MKFKFINQTYKVKLTESSPKLTTWEWYTAFVTKVQICLLLITLSTYLNILARIHLLTYSYCCYCDHLVRCWSGHVARRQPVHRRKCPPWSNCVLFRFWSSGYLFPLEAIETWHRFLRSTDQLATFLWNSLCTLKTAFLAYCFKGWRRQLPALDVFPHPQNSSDDLH